MCHVSNTMLQSAGALGRGGGDHHHAEAQQGSKVHIHKVQWGVELPVYVINQIVKCATGRTAKTFFFFPKGKIQTHPVNIILKFAPKVIFAIVWFMISCLLLIFFFIITAKVRQSHGLVGDKKIKWKNLRSTKNPPKNLLSAWQNSWVWFGFSTSVSSRLCLPPPCWQALSCIYRCFKLKADRLDYPLPSAADVKRNSRPRLTAGKTAEQLSRLHSRAVPPGPQCQPLTRSYCTYTAVSHNEDKKKKKKRKRSVCWCSGTSQLQEVRTRKQSCPSRWSWTFPNLLVNMAHIKNHCQTVCKKRRPTAPCAERNRVRYC